MLKGGGIGRGSSGAAQSNRDPASYPSDGSPIGIYQTLAAKLSGILNYGEAGVTGDDLADARIQAGDLVFTCTATALCYARKGYMLCTGQQVKQVDWPNLYANIGDVWNLGLPVAAGYFCIPDFRGLTPMGAYTAITGVTPILTPSNLARQDPGDRIGTEGTTLGTNNLPPHRHPPAGSFPFVTANDPAGGTWLAGSGVAKAQAENFTGYFPAQASTPDEFSNRPPSIAVNVLIKT